MFSKNVVDVKDLKIGGSYPVRVQTMYDDRIYDCDVNEVVRRIKLLQSMGCDLIRFSYVSSRDKENFTKICKLSPIPIVADIHFDYKLALEAIECGCAKVRINPGNIGPRFKSEEVFKAARDNNVAIRIGLNSGSLPRNDKGYSKSHLMVETALEYLSWADNLNFKNSIVSLKASDVNTTLEANLLLKERCDAPIHLGVTEAGGVITSSIRSSYALGQLLNNHIGDTIRVSITGNIEAEIQAANEILRTVGLKKDGIRVVSCPRCGRHSFDSMGFLSRVERRLNCINKNLTVAIMGCQVNGPGEAKDADVAITGLGNKNFIYKNGKLFCEVNADDAEKALFDVIESL